MRGKFGEFGPAGSRFPAVVLNGFFQGSGPAIMQQENLPSLGICRQPQAPQGRSSPFTGAGRTFRIMIVQLRPHIVEE